MKKNYTIDEKIEYYEKKINEIIKEWGNPENYDKWDEQTQCTYLHTFTDHKYDFYKKRLKELKELKKLEKEQIS